MAKLNLGFLASHNGSNMQSIIDSCNKGELDAEPRCVISNNSKSGALERAKDEGIPAYHISSLKYPEQEDLDDAIIEAFEKHNVEIIVLAGYMKKLGDKVIERFNGRVLNIHPALLPKFGGKGMFGEKVHKAVLQAGETESGPSVHLVNNEYDKGRILAQKKTKVYPDDTVDSLSSRVLELEHQIYPETLQKIAQGEIKI